MKRVVVKYDYLESITVNKCVNPKYYGIYTRAMVKAFVVFDPALGKWRFVEVVPAHNVKSFDPRMTLGAITADPLEELLSRLLDTGASVFQFDDWGEFSSWLGEGT